MNKKQVIETLKMIYDPELPVNIYDLKLIREVQIENKHASILMTLTTPNCPVADSLPETVKYEVQNLDGIDSCEVTMTFDPPWDLNELDDATKLQLGML